jgi:hypothetical protein
MEKGQIVDGEVETRDMHTTCLTEYMKGRDRV